MVEVHSVKLYSWHSMKYIIQWVIVHLERIQYMVFVFLLLMLEAGVTADLFLNRDWEEACTLYIINLSDKFMNSIYIHINLFGYNSDLFYLNQDFPADQTGNFNELKNFVRSNFRICKWIGLSIVSVQVSHPPLCRTHSLFSSLWVWFHLFMRLLVTCLYILAFKWRKRITMKWLKWYHCKSGSTNRNFKMWFELLVKTN